MCEDWRGTTVAFGDAYLRYTDRPCFVCTCGGDIDDCTNQICPANVRCDDRIAKTPCCIDQGHCIQGKSVSMEYVHNFQTFLVTFSCLFLVCVLLWALQRMRQNRLRQMLVNIHLRGDPDSFAPTPSHILHWSQHQLRQHQVDITDMAVALAETGLADPASILSVELPIHAFEVKTVDLPPLPDYFDDRPPIYCSTEELRQPLNATDELQPSRNIS